MKEEKTVFGAGFGVASVGEELQPAASSEKAEPMERLAALARLASTFDPRSSAPRFLESVMEACGGDCALWLNARWSDEEGPREWRGALEADVIARGSVALESRLLLTDFSWSDPGTARWADELNAGILLEGNLKELPAEEQAVLSRHGLQWFAAAPLMTINGWSGCLLVGSRKAGRIAPAGLLFMETAAQVMSSALWRVETEQALSEARTHLDNILRYSTEYAILVTDLHFRVLQYNQVAEALLDFPPASITRQILPQTVLARHLQVENLSRVEEAVRAEGKWECEVSLGGQTPESAERTVNFVVSGIYLRHPRSGVQGPQSRYLIFARDVTAQRHRERGMLESQRMESVGLLAGGIAHDFNNILMGILGYASLAKDILGPQHEAYRMVNTIEQSAERAASLTSQLLAYARGGKLQTVPVDLELLVSEMLNIIGSNIPKSIAIRREAHENLPNIMADPSQIQQVIMNLCLNASEAIIENMRQQPAGSQRGTIELRSSVVRLTERPAGLFSGDDFTPEGDYVVLEVSDNGCGMDAATVQRIFEPFFTTKFTGRGLGLAAVQGIVRNHGGTMTVSSTRGVGTTFTLYLPATAAVAAQPVALEMLSLEGDETVLIIDDEEVARQLDLLTLANLGYRVLLASNGTEGLEVYREHMEDISLVLLDVTMPEMGGADVLAELSTMKRVVPILLTSGYDEAMVGSMPPIRYLSGFLQKPYTPEILARAVREVLNANAENREAAAE